jgi:hypothetical protein
MSELGVNVGGRGENSPRSRGCVTQAAKLLALPPNQNGYRMAVFAIFCFFCSSLAALATAAASDADAMSAVACIVGWAASMGDKGDDSRRPGPFRGDESKRWATCRLASFFPQAKGGGLLCEGPRGGMRWARIMSALRSWGSWRRQGPCNFFSVPRAARRLGRGLRHSTPRSWFHAAQGARCR